nr:hypothetical protein [Tanacetum cinerariifolium]
MNGWVDDDEEEEDEEKKDVDMEEDDDAEIIFPYEVQEARMREIIRDQFATSMSELMANMNSGAGGP